LIQTEVGKASSVAKAVSAIAGVTIAEGVTGPYDVIMRAESASMEDLGRTVLAKVQTVAGITRTLTCPVTTF
jgi:DNA-binding Lrp family transcriptional regulator